MHRWILLVICVLVAVGCAGLSRWQWQRLDQRRARNAEALDARNLPPIDITAGHTVPLVANRRVTVRGRFDPSAAIVLRGRVYQGAPGVHIVGTFHITGSDTAVLIDRGFVPAPDAASPKNYAPPTTEEMVLSGLAFPLKTQADRGTPITRPAGTTWGTLDVGIRPTVSVPLHDYWILEAHDTTARGWPRAVEPAPLDDGPHLSYAIQWLALGVTAMVFGVVFVRRADRRNG